MFSTLFINYITMSENYVPKTLLENETLKLTLLGGQTKSGTPIWWSNFNTSEEKLTTVVIDEACQKVIIKKEDGQVGPVQFSLKKREDGSEFLAANIGGYAVYLNPSSYAGCPYYASIKISNYVPEEIDVDLGDDVTF